MSHQTYDTIVVGGGQAGLAVGHELARKGQNFVIIDASRRVGDSWRNRWDSLLLFTPAMFNGLPGMDFPADPEHFVSKDEMGDFLQRYAVEMDLPVLSGVEVRRLYRDHGEFAVDTADESFRSRNVVVAMANYQHPYVPSFAGELDDHITQIHSSAYRNLGQLAEGPALIVGLGNSGADIGLEVARDRETYVSGKESATIPFRIEGWFGRKIGMRTVRFLATKVLTTSTPMGRKMRPKVLDGSAPLVRVKPGDLTDAGAVRVPRVVGVRGGLPETADGKALEVANVIWCTGYTPGFDWIDLPVTDDDGKPRQARGIVADQPGLYFCGLFFQHSLWSETVTGVRLDARYVVDHLVATDQERKRVTDSARV